MTVRGNVSKPRPCQSDGAIALIVLTTMGIGTISASARGRPQSRTRVEPLP